MNKKQIKRNLRKFVVSRLKSLGVQVIRDGGSTMSNEELFDSYKLHYNEDPTDSFIRYEKERGRVKSKLRLESNVGYVYLFTCEKIGVCKIGFSKDPHKRLNHVQVGFPYKLILANYREGTMLDEKNLHNKNSQRRLNGEWFTLEGIVF